MRETEYATPSSGRLEIRLFGCFEVILSGEPIPEGAWGRSKTKTLLKILLTEPGGAFPHDQLIEALFAGDDPSKGRSNLYSRVSRLRRVLEPELEHGRDSYYILRRGQGYSFNAEAGAQVDTIEFQRGLRSAHGLADDRDWVHAVKAFETAIPWYRGNFLPEDRYEPWAESAANRLHDQHLDALLILSDCYAQLGRLRQAISSCQRVLAIEPHREDAVCRLMEYQDQAGQRSEALETYKEAERVLREYLDVEPSAETQAAYRAIRDRQTAADEPLDPRRVAVLPLANYSPDPDDAYFADGMTEELIGCLSKIGDLRVVARTSVMRYKDTHKSISQISRELGVGTLLEGSVQKVAEEFRVTVQLIDGASEDHLWAEEYDRSLANFLSAQRDVAQQVARVLSLQLLPDEGARIRSVPTESAEAHTLYLKGLFFFQKETDFPKAIDYYEKALAIDPEYALAHTGIANTLVFMSRSGFTPDSVLSRVRDAVHRALELDPTLAAAHASLGLFLWVFERDPDGAAAEFRRAIALNPSYGQAHEWLGNLMGQASRFEEALHEARESLALQPLLPDAYSGVGGCLIGAGRYEEAIEYCEQARELDPQYRNALNGLAWAKERLWRWAEAEAHRREVRALFPESPHANRRLVNHLVFRGRIDEALELIRGFPRERSNEVVLGFYEGYCLCMARRHREAIDVLTRCAGLSEIGMLLSGKTAINRLLGIAHAGIGKDKAALRSFEASRREAEALRIPFFAQQAGIGLALTRSRMGDEVPLRELIERFDRRSRERDITPLLAILSFARGDLDAGFEWLRIAVERRERQPLLEIKVHPWFDPARDDPRFTAILKSMNLVD